MFYLLISLSLSAIIWYNVKNIDKNSVLEKAVVQANKLKGLIDKHEKIKRIWEKYATNLFLKQIEIITILSHSFITTLLEPNRVDVVKIEKITTDKTKDMSSCKTDILMTNKESELITNPIVNKVITEQKNDTNVNEVTLEQKTETIEDLYKTPNENNKLSETYEEDIYTGLIDKTDDQIVSEENVDDTQPISNIVIIDPIQLMTAMQQISFPYNNDLYNFEQTVVDSVDKVEQTTENLENKVEPPSVDKAEVQNDSEKTISFQQPEPVQKIQELDESSDIKLNEAEKPINKIKIGKKVKFSDDVINSDNHKVQAKGKPIVKKKGNKIMVSLHK